MNAFSEIFGDGGEEEEAGVGPPVSEWGGRLDGFTPAGKGRGERGAVAGVAGL